jgi:hypothetical protein
MRAERSDARRTMGRARAWPDLTARTALVDRDDALVVVGSSTAPLGFGAVVLEPPPVGRTLGVTDLRREGALGRSTMAGAPSYCRGCIGIDTASPPATTPPRTSSRRLASPRVRS